MLDSPYVRRVAISLQMLGLPFTHRSLSVFSTYAQFREVNPVVKAPSLVCDDGTVLMDSTLILDYAEAIAGPGRSLMPEAAADRLRELHVIGLALAACEKSVQIVYERMLRPEEKRHAPWVERITEQTLSAYAALERTLQQRPLRATPTAMGQAAITTAVTWHFTQSMLPDVVAAERYPWLAAFSAAAEARPEFKAAPHGDSTYRA